MTRSKTTEEVATGSTEKYILARLDQIEGSLGRLSAGRDAATREKPGSLHYTVALERTGGGVISPSEALDAVVAILKLTGGTAMHKFEGSKLIINIEGSRLVSDADLLLAVYDFGLRLVPTGTRVAREEIES